MYLFDDSLIINDVSKRPKSNRGRGRPPGTSKKSDSSEQVEQSKLTRGRKRSLPAGGVEDTDAIEIQTDIVNVDNALLVVDIMSRRQLQHAERENLNNFRRWAPAVDLQCVLNSLRKIRKNLDAQ